MFYLLDMQTVEQPRKLRFGDSVNIAGKVFREMEFALFQALVQQAEAVPVPIEHFWRL